MMAAYKFGHCLTGGGGTPAEPNFMLSSKLLSDMAGLGMTIESLPHYPLVGDHGAGANTLSVRLPSNVGDRAIPSSGLCIIEQDPTTGTLPVDARRSPTLAGAVGNAAHSFMRTPVDANGVSTVTLLPSPATVTGAIFQSNARVYLFTAAMNGPKKHGFQGEVKSYDWLSVLQACVQNFIDYAIPGE